MTYIHQRYYKIYVHTYIHWVHLLCYVIEELDAGSRHDGLRDGVDLAVHHKLLLLGQLHEDDSEQQAKIH